MSTSFTRTRLEIARRVLGKVTKAAPAAASVASADLDTCYEALDLLLKEMHKRGIFWRKVTTVPVTFSLTAGIATASAGAGDILFPMKLTFSNEDTDQPIYLMGISEYAELQDKTQTGEPIRALWKGGSEFIFFPVPTSNGTAKLLYEKIADDTSAGAAVDIDVAMIRPMMDLIKYDVADDFGIDEQIQQRWRVEAQQAEIDIRKLGVQHTDLATIAVDDWAGRQDLSGRTSDY